MSGLLYREDMDEARRRLTHYWHGGDIGRPVMAIYAPREEPAAQIPAMPKPEGWITDYSVSNFDYRVNIAERACINTWYLGEAIPTVTADLGPSCLALYLGCEGVDEPETVWFRPCISDPEKAEFKYDRNNFYWDFTLRLAREQLRVCGGKAMMQYPDLIEGLDTLAAMRGSQTLLVDLLTNPDWIHSSLRQITDLYFHYYDILYDLFRDEVGGSYWWIWAPGRMAKFQCDFSAMIGPEMFEEYMYPLLCEMCERVSYNMYHWDGPGAIPHLKHLLNIPSLKMIQWVPGAGRELPDHRQWWPFYHQMLDAGKKPFIYHCTGADSLRALRKEFGAKFNQFYLMMQASSKQEGEEWLKLAEE